MTNPPSGNITFLFTDIEGSTKMAQTDAGSMQDSLSKHNLILHEVVDSNNGFIFKSIGDAYCCAFENIGDAIKSAVEIQIKLNSEEWGEASIKVRMGIYSGKAEWSGTDYIGYVTMATANRIMSSSYGGQILVSCPEIDIEEIIVPDGISFRNLGERRLKDLKDPIRLYQLISPGLPSDFPPIRTLDIRPNNLPVQLTSFIGREKELTEIKKILQSSRLLTLIGTGGTGKTRLSIQAGADMIDEFENGVRIIEFASLNDPSLISNEIASVLNLKEIAGRNIEEVILDFLKEKEILLILDNCEHVIIECAVVANSLLGSCPKLKIIASSREPLRIPGEKVFQVPALSMPGIKETITKESAGKFESVRLFIERAISVKTDFEVTDQNAPALARLCAQLDGIPLAIELAAARIKILNVEKILENINNRFKLLRGGGRTLLPRQQTLQALIDWSYDLLTEKEKLLFARLSVFSGGWNLEAAKEICAGEEMDEFEIMDLLSNLINKSLVISIEKNGGTLFSMLHTIHQYSFEKLLSKNEIYLKHFNYFQKISFRCHPDVDIKVKIAWNETMENEQDNIRSAIRWSLENSPPLSAELILSESEYLENRGNYSESFELVKKIIKNDIESTNIQKIDAFSDAAYLAGQIDGNEIAEKYLLKALEYCKIIGSKSKEADCLNIYGILAILNGEPEKSEKHFEESLKLLQNLDEKILKANTLANYAMYLSNVGNYGKGLFLLEEASEIYKKFNNKDLFAKTLVSKGGIYFQEGELEKARTFIQEGLPILEELNDQFSVTTTLYNLGNLNFAQKNYSESTDCYEAVMLKSKEYGYKNVFDRAYIKLGETALIQNQNAKAKEIFLGCLKSFNEDSEKLKLILSIYGLGNYYFQEKKYEQSAKLFLLAQRITKIYKIQLSKSRADEQKNIINELRNTLSENKFNFLEEEIRSLNLNHTTDIVLSMCND